MTAHSSIRVIQWLGKLWIVCYVALAVPLGIFVWHSVESIKPKNDVRRYRVLFQVGILGPAMKSDIDVLDEISRNSTGSVSAIQRVRLENSRRLMLSHLTVMKPYIDLMSNVHEENKLATQMLDQIAHVQSTLDAIDIAAKRSLPPARANQFINSLEDSMAFFEGTVISALEMDMYTQVKRANQFAEVICELFFLFLLAGMAVTHLILVLRRKNQKLKEFATFDTLTGLLNRGSAVERANDFVALARRMNAPVSVAVIDLDHFKRINDTHGHPAGDSVLKAAANTIGAHRRKNDIAARFGGEEFIIVMFDTEAQEALRVCERVRRELETTAPLIDGKPIPITASIGLATLPGVRTQFETLYSLADQALYQAKGHGRNRTVVAHTA